MIGDGTWILSLALLSLNPVAERALSKHATIKAPVARVWNAWTSSDGIASFFAPASNVDLQIGGAYELYMSTEAPKASRGTEGCKVLAFVPNRMLAFEWNFPPSIASLRDADRRTFVVLEFREIKPGETDLRLTQLGWQTGEDWDKGYEYFDNAWSVVLTNLNKTATAGRLPAISTQADQQKTKKWKDGKVSVTATYGQHKRQDFEILLPEQVEKVWRLLATSEGLGESLHPGAKVELQPGGKYAVWQGATNKVMAYVPNRMLAITGSAPPKFPNVRKGGTWGVYFLERLDSNSTRLVLSSLGWREGEKEWDDAFDYFLKANVQYLEMVFDSLTK